jgi:hypothetical protein
MSCPCNFDIPNFSRTLKTAIAELVLHYPDNIIIQRCYDDIVEITDTFVRFEFEDFAYVDYVRIFVLPKEWKQVDFENGGMTQWGTRKSFYVTMHFDK